MIIAQRLQYTRRADYLLYMWQVEDLIRAYDCDICRIDDEYLSRFTDLDTEQRHEMHTWYANLCIMMRDESKTSGGHLQICQNVIIGLAELHDALMASSRFPYYAQFYHRVLPYIVELRTRRSSSNDSATDKTANMQNEDTGALQGSAAELLTLLEAMYGVLLLRLQHREISEETKLAQKDISAFIATLSDYWTKERNGELDLE